jgi:hypothetical protein
VLVAWFFACILLFAQAARGADLLSSDSGWLLWQATGFAKSTTLALDYRGLDAWQALAQADRAAQQVTRLRLGTDLYLGQARVSAEYELRTRIDSTGWIDAATGTGFGATTARPRLWDPDAHGSDGLYLEHDLDRAWVGLPLGPIDLKLGRQAVSWGSAWFWKPTDRFGPFSPFDVDPDVKRGVDAARAEVSLGPTTSLDLVGTFERHPGTDRPLWANAGARFRTTLWEYDLAVSLARFQGSVEAGWMAGLEFSGGLGQVGFRGEAAFNLGEESRDTDLEAVLGLDHRFACKLHLAGEAFYNGYGVAHTSEYSAFLADPTRSERLARGEAFGLGRWYLGLSGDQELHPLLHATLGAIGNLGDPSLLILAGLLWSVHQDTRLSLGALVPVGEAPEGLAPRSEFGYAPLAAYAVLKVAF